jgi:hypothetical protein
LVVIADGVESCSGYDELILSAIHAGVCSIYFWGPRASNAEDIAVFGVAYHEVMNGTPLKTRDGFIWNFFPNESAIETVALLIESYVPDAVENKKETILVVCGLSGSPYLDEFWEALKNYAS